MVNSIALLILLSSVNAQQVRGPANAETDERRSLIETYEQAGGSEYTTTRQPVTRKLGSFDKRSKHRQDHFNKHKARCLTRHPRNARDCKTCGGDWIRDKCTIMGGRPNFTW